MPDLPFASAGRPAKLRPRRLRDRPAEAVCPVNPAKDCLDCHMPKVPVAALHTSLTDHYIRVHDRSEEVTAKQISHLNDRVNR